MKNWLTLLLLCWSCTGFSQYACLPDTSRYPWIQPDLCRLQFYHPDAVRTFYQAWKSADTAKCVIVHMGDSHVQPDILPDELRKVLQDSLGAGGRGFVFPYSTAKTYSSSAYKSTHEGEWSYGKSFILPPKVKLGLVGMACRTADSSASFNLCFKEPFPADYSILRIYCKKDSAAYDFEVLCDSVAFPVSVTTSLQDPSPYIELHVPAIKKSLTLRLLKTSSSQNFFECYGLEIQSPRNKGVVVHSAGVGGACFRGLLYQDLLEEQLACVQPDLVILDYGTNDYLYDDKIKSTLEAQILKSIEKVRSVSPEVSILLTSTQDMYRRGRNLKSGVLFSDFMRRIAKQNNCLFFDWYWISGGPKSMKLWENAGLAQPDMIHLGGKGARLKGDLLALAMTRTIEWLNENPGADSLVLAPDSSQRAALLAIQHDTAHTAPTEFTQNARYYTIRSGDNLGSIAQRYGVSVAQLKSWNGLSSDRIVAGKVLKILKKNVATDIPKPAPLEEKESPLREPAPTTTVKSPTKSQPATMASTGVAAQKKTRSVYVVKSGDTLWALARRYNTSVDAIKSANKLRTDKLNIGQKIIIPH